jgi:hypothetical protein
MRSIANIPSIDFLHRSPKPRLEPCPRLSEGDQAWTGQCASTNSAAPEVLKIEEADIPEPGPGEVRIAVQAIGLNRADALWRQKLYIEDATLPAGLATRPRA